MEAANISPKYARNLDEAQDLFSSGIYVAIPILNEADVVQDVFFGTKIATDEKVKIDLPVVINAGVSSVLITAASALDRLEGTTIAL